MLRTLGPVLILLLLAGCATPQETDASDRDEAAAKVDVGQLSCPQKLSLMEETTGALEVRHTQQRERDETGKALALGSYVPIAGIFASMGLTANYWKNLSTGRLTELNWRLTHSFLSDCVSPMTGDKTP